MGALDGIRVLDLSIIVQGPQAGQMLHDLGADVVKVELPLIGDLVRYLTISPTDTRSAFVFACNRGKRSVGLDLRTPGGKRALERLARTADVLIANFQPGTLESWGLGYDDLSAINPRLVYATASGLGDLGADADREGADLMGQAQGGLISTTGIDGGEPTTIGAAIADVSGSQNLVVGILAALLHREKTGRGQQLHVSLLGSMIWAQASEFTQFFLTGAQPGRANRSHPMIRALYGLFPTADGWIAIIGVVQPLWAGFCRAIDRDDLAEDARYNTVIVAPEHVAELWRMCNEIFPTRTTAEWCERLRAEKQRYAPVWSYEQIVSDPQPWTNGYLTRGTHPEYGDIGLVGFPIRFSETPARSAVEIPEVGQHTEEVLLEAGLEWEEIEKLRADGAW